MSSELLYILKLFPILKRLTYWSCSSLSIGILGILWTISVACILVGLERLLSNRLRIEGEK